MKESADLEKAKRAPAQRNAEVSSPIVDERGMTEGPLVQMVQRARCMGCNPSFKSVADVISRLPVAQRRAAAMSLQRIKGNRFVQRMALQAKSEPNRTGMPDHLKAEIERLSGLDISDVRVHTNSDKPARLNALAYTQGNQIHLGPGQERHLPHEAWHVVQQKQGRVKPTMQLKDGVLVNDDMELEHEADVTRKKAFTSGHNVFSRQGPYELGSRVSQKLMAYELTHVVQQNGGAVRRLPQLQNKQQSLVQWRQEYQPTKSPLHIQFTSLAQPTIQRMLMIGGQGYTDPESIREEALKVGASLDASRATIERLMEIGPDEEVIVKYPTWGSALAAYDTPTTIPPLIHFIWMGRPPSDVAIRNILSWASRAKNTGWRVILWTDFEIQIGDWTKAMENLGGYIQVENILNVIDRDLAEFYTLATRGRSRAFNMASDLARYSILQKYGGVYADVDIGPGGVDLTKVPVQGINSVPMLAPQVRDRRALEEQLSQNELRALDLAGATKLAATKAYLANQLNNNLIIMQPHSAFMRQLILNVHERVKNDLANQSEWAQNAALITGPQAVIKTMFYYMGMPDRLIDLFNPETFENWSQLEWITEESERQTYGQEKSKSTASSILTRLGKYFK